MKDLLLIKGLVNRDKLVFDYVFNYYYSSLCAFCLMYFDDRSTVEDLVQDFFVSLWFDAPRLNIKSSLKSYLYTSVKNRCLDSQKHKKVTRKYQTYMLFSSENSNNQTEQYFAESELRHALQNGLEKLSPSCRRIFEMSRISGLSNLEISEQLSISKRTVELQISNSLKILRKELVEFLPIWLVLWLIG